MIKKYEHRIMRTTAAALAITFLAGCAEIPKSINRAKQAESTATAFRDAAVENATSASVSRTSRSRLAGEEIQLRAKDALPAVFARQITFNTQGAQSLSEALDTVSTMAGISIRSSEISGSKTSTANPMVPAPQVGAITGRFTLEYSGTLRRLLDEIASRNEASWRYVARTNSIEFFRYETKTLSVYLPPGTKTIDSSISLSGISGGGSGGGEGGGGGPGGGNNGGANVAVTQNMTINPWGSIMGGIQSILSEGGGASNEQSQLGMGRSTGVQSKATMTSASGPAGRAAANPELGIITVTARPEALARITAYINSVNARFAQNVLIDIKVFNLTMDTQASLGFSLDALYNNLGKYGVSVVGANPLQPATGTPSQMTITKQGANSRWNGSQVVAQALAQFGNVALQTQGQVIAINGQPSPIQVANEVNYLASSATTQTANVGSTTTLTPGSRVVGFTANFLPMILGDNRILLQYALQISSLTALTQISSGTNSIQTPQISSQSLQQQAFVNDGQAIVLFGFDQNRDSSGASAGFAGASKVIQSERQMVVIVIQVNGGSKNV